MIKIDLKDKDSPVFTPVDYDNIRNLQKKDVVGSSEEYETTLGDQAPSSFVADEIFEDVVIVEDKATIPDLEEIKKLSIAIAVPIEKKTVDLEPQVLDDIIDNPIEDDPILTDSTNCEINPNPQKDNILDEAHLTPQPMDNLEVSETDNCENKEDDSPIEEQPVIPEPELVPEPNPVVDIVPTPNVEPEPEPELSFRDKALTTGSIICRDKFLTEDCLDPLEDDREFLHRDEVVYDSKLSKEEINIVHKKGLSGGVVFLISMLTSLVVLSGCLIIYLLFFSMDSKQTQYISDININLQQLNNILDTERIAIDSYVSRLSSKEDLIVSLNGVNSLKKEAYLELKKIEVPNKKSNKQIHALAEGIFITSLNSTSAIFNELENSNSSSNILDIYNEYVELFNSNVYLYNTYVENSLSNKSILGG